MSRIDEALRRTAGNDDRAAAEPRAHAADASMVERYAPENPAGLKISVPPAPPLVMAPPPVMASPSVTAPPPATAPPSVKAPQAVRRAAPVRFRAPLGSHLVVSPDITPVSVEQYRRLAATLYDLQNERGLKTLMVSSSVPREGKTLTIANLALTLATSFHQRVCVIDADLRRPSVHEVFDIPNHAGLGDVLRAGGRTPFVEITSHLSVLTAGRADANPLAQLASERIQTVLSDAAANFDWVLVDAPPVAFLPDAQMVARLSEGVLFVISAGVTPYALVQRCVAELGPERIVGIVLNKVEEGRFRVNDYYYPERAGR